MESFLIRLLQFIMAISLLVLLHEGGHMFFAKLFGVRVEKFFCILRYGYRQMERYVVQVETQE